MSAVFPFIRKPLIHAGTDIIIGAHIETELLIEILFALRRGKADHELITGLELRTDKSHDLFHQLASQTLSLILGNDNDVSDVDNITVIPDDSSDCNRSSLITEAPDI